jgi:hypothetical protein
VNGKLAVGGDAWGTVSAGAAKALTCSFLKQTASLEHNKHLSAAIGNPPTYSSHLTAIAHSRSISLTLFSASSFAPQTRAPGP